MLRATAPPSEQYNDPSLRTRSKTIDNLIKREDEKSCKEFGRIDSIQKDWANQDKMNKIAQLRSAPPTYSPPKPPPILESKEEDRRLFRSNSMHRARFNTFSMDSLPKIGGKKRKKKEFCECFRPQPLIRLPSNFWPEIHSDGRLESVTQFPDTDLKIMFPLPSHTHTNRKG